MNVKLPFSKSNSMGEWWIEISTEMKIRDRFGCREWWEQLAATNGFIFVNSFQCLRDLSWYNTQKYLKGFFLLCIMEKNCQCYEDNVVKQIQFVLEGIGLPVVGKEHHHTATSSHVTINIGDNFNILLTAFPSIGCFKKPLLKEICDFLTLKMLQFALALIKTKNRHLFDPLVRNAHFTFLYLNIQIFYSKYWYSIHGNFESLILLEY